MTDSRWAEAMTIKMEALKKNSTWEMVPLPQGKKPVGCRWIYTIKYKADGSIDRYKARLVAKGYTQTYGIDFQETFAPAKINTVRVLISLAANLDWPLLTRRSVYGSTTRDSYDIQSQYRRQAEKISVWAKTVTSSLVWEIY